MSTPERPTIHLQAIGPVSAKPAKDFVIGEFAMWNFGSTSKIVAISPRGKTQLTWIIETSDEKRSKRVVKADRLVAIAEGHVRPKRTRAK